MPADERHSRQRSPSERAAGEDGSAAEGPKSKGGSATEGPKSKGGSATRGAHESKGDSAAPDLRNADIAAALSELGDLYELDGAIVHRVLAYRTAAKSVEEASVSVSALAREGSATKLPGIGKTIQEKIVALLNTGAIPAATRLRRRYPPACSRSCGCLGLARSGREGSTTSFASTRLRR